MEILASYVLLAVTALIVVLDASQLRKENPFLYTSKIIIAPAVWGIVTCLFAFVSVPIYLVVRYSYFNDYDKWSAGAGELSERVGFIKTAICAKVVIAWMFCVSCAYVIASLLASSMHLSAQTLAQALDAQLFLSFLSIMAFFILSYLATRKSPSVRLRDLFDLKYQKISKLKLFVAPLVVSVVLSFISALIMSLRKTTPTTPLGTALDESTPSVVLLFIAFAVCLAPMFEELLYRGLIFRVFYKSKGKIWALVVVSLVFWVVHLDRAGDNLALLVLLVLSFCMTWLRLWTRTTISPIIMHYTYNICQFVFGILMLFVFHGYPLEYLTIESLPPERQEAILIKIVEKNQKFAPAYNNLAWIYAEEGRDLEEALALVSRALELEPEEPAFLDTKAEVLYQLGRLEEAIDLETSIVKRFPQNAIFKKQLEKFKSKIESKATVS